MEKGRIDGYETLVEKAVASGGGALLMERGSLDWFFEVREQYAGPLPGDSTFPFSGGALHFNSANEKRIFPWTLTRLANTLILKNGIMTAGCRLPPERFIGFGYGRFRLSRPDLAGFAGTILRKPDSFY